MREQKLAWGLNAEIPEEVEVCWGARWIYPDDMVHDRQDFKGIDTPEGKRLKEWLNNGAIRRAQKKARECNMLPNEDRTIVLYEDKTGIVKGNCNGSYGYLYVCAYLKKRGPAVEPEPKERVKKETQPRF